MRHASKCSTYCFFLRLHSLAASLRKHKHTSNTPHSLVSECSWATGTHTRLSLQRDDTTMQLSPYSTVAWHCVKSLFATLGQIICTRQSLYCVTLNLRCYSVLWLYRTFKALSSSMSVLFCFSRTATRFSRHLTYSFFFRRHSRAASLEATTERLCKQESILYSVYRSHCLRHHQSKRTCKSKANYQTQKSNWWFTKLRVFHFEQRWDRESLNACYTQK